MTDTKELIANFPEINLNNYSDDEVNALNAWGIAAHTALESFTQRLSEYEHEVTHAQMEAMNLKAERDALQSEVDMYKNPQKLNTSQERVQIFEKSNQVLVEALKAMERATQTNDAYVQAEASQQCRSALVAAQQAQPERAPLSIQEIADAWGLKPENIPASDIEAVREIEAAHGIKQGGQQ